jgi:8-amino-7-oxononanoate synthase
VPTDSFLGDELAAREAAGLRRRLRAVEGRQAARVAIDGRSLISLCSNNYLGLADHPALIEAAVAAARELGVGAGASRLVSGSMRLHHRLEERLAAFKGTRRALLFNSGYHANLGTIQALVGKEDAVFSDALNHASLIDGCRLSRAALHVYPHRDAGALAALLGRVTARRKLIVTDSVFSMDGDTAPLAEICALAERHGAMVMVDEAHATGVLGRKGAGLVEALGLQGRVDVQMGTLGKALGGFGAYVAGSETLIEYLLNCARTFVYTTALPPPVVAAALAALDVVEREPERRAAALANAARLRSGLHRLGYEVPAGEAAIVPVLLGDAALTMRVSDALLLRGVLALGIRPPTVPAGTARIRTTVMATHTQADVDAALDAFAAVKAEGR